MSNIVITYTLPVSVRQVAELIQKAREGNQIVFEGKNARMTISSVIGALVVKSDGEISIFVSSREEDVATTIASMLENLGFRVDEDSPHGN